ncbi:exodeoxyribonuclease VII small subunit [compost metagenome]
MTQSKTIQQKTTELTELVAWFDSDEFTLEQALDKFKEAEALAQAIEQDLTTLRNEIEVVKKSFDSES